MSQFISSHYHTHFVKDDIQIHCDVNNWPLCDSVVTRAILTLEYDVLNLFQVLLSNLFMSICCLLSAEPHLLESSSSGEIFSLVYLSVNVITSKVGSGRAAMATSSLPCWVKKHHWHAHCLWTSLLKDCVNAQSLMMKI